ncbi:MAG: CUB domain-containing protein [Vicingaceae bacterium]
MNYLYSLVLSALFLLSPADQKPTDQSAFAAEEVAENNLPAPSNCIASPDPLAITQADGSTLSLRGRGNMNNSWTETIDGYTVVKNQNGFYEYAEKVNNQFQASGVRAHNLGARSIAENNFLSGLQKSIQPLKNNFKSSILNQVRRGVQNKSYPTTGSINILALLIEYPDLTSTFPASNFDSLLYGANYRSGDGSFKYFYETATDSQLTINVDVRGWYMAANPYLYYGRDSGTSRAADLVREAVDAAEAAGINYANYDNDGDNQVDGILAVHAGQGAEQGAMTQYIWSHRWVLNGGSLGAVTYDGVQINDYMMNPETRLRSGNQNMVGIGVFCHEFGHNLGLPDLYDTDDANGDSEGIGEWGLMGSASWLGGEHRPGNFSAWSKEESGWATPTVLNVGSSGTYTLDAASVIQDDIYRINTGVGNEYFLVENRQKVGLDFELNGSGLAIWHINTNKTNSFGNSVNADENLKGVDLEEADGLNDLDNEVNRGDAGDLFPGTSNVTVFNDMSSPSAMTYSGSTTGIQISNIVQNGNQISFSFGNSSSQACTGGDTLTATSGTFNDGSSATANYNNNLNCNWLIQPPGAASVTLNFNRFDVDNTIDRVAVYDGTDFSAPLIGTYTGTSIPATINSSGGALFLEFTTNGSINSLGWEATYSSSAGATCSGTTTLSNPSGTFNDGSGPNVDYSNSLNCSWLVSPTGAFNVRLTFDSLDLVAGDSLYVYDGTANTDPLIGAYSGSTLPAFITSSGADAFIEFTTDASGTDKGWQISYLGISGCSGQQTLSAASGTFNDGTNANQLYRDNSNCTWLIQPPGANFISLSWNRFNVESGFDFVTVYDGNNLSAPVIGTYSGSNLPPSVTSSGGSLLVEFTTDFTVTEFGWEATYISTTTQCLPNRTLTANNGSFSDGSGASNYTNNLNCGWLIQPSNANSITLSFSAFDTESNIDSVSVYDGIDNTAPLVATYSGNTIPSNTVVNGPAMYVEFISNGSNTAAGWDASYTSTSSLSCSGQTTFTAASGSFDDGSGTSNYDNNLNCSWLIQPSGSPAIITLSFTSMDLRFGDRVRIYDGTNNSGNFIGIRSGTNPGNPVTATSGAMFLEFTSNNFSNADGWDATYSSSNTFCVPLTTLTANFGNVNDGSGFQNYANNSDCAWLIQPTAPNVAVSFDLFNFNTEATNDTLTIYDGPNASSPILQTLSGNLGNPAPIVSSGGDMFMTFKTNGSVRGAGWQGQYTTQTIPACSGTTTLTAATGTFDDGSAATADYIENSDCAWLIQPSGANKIFLSFSRFATQNGADTVTVYDGPNTSAPILGTFSGTTIPPNLISSGGSMYLTFKANNFIEDTGWEASYNSSNTQCFSNLTLTNFRDTIEDGSGSSNYGNNLSCSWLIQPNTAQSINLDFLSMDLQANDVVSVYDGSNNSAAFLGSFSGTTIPSTISSTGGSMFIEFTTDGSGNAAGWRATYDIVSSLSCIGTTTLTAPSGAFDDGSGTGNYDNNLNCSWLIQPSNNPLTISLSVNSNALANFGDRLRVYDGTSTAGTFIGNFFNGNTGTVTANSGSMFLVFETDGNFTDQGWDVTYSSSTSYCTQNNTFTANFGNFTDGSPFGIDYVDNTDCSWLIQPATPNVAIALNIFSIDTEFGNDTITVYDGATTSDPILGTFSGTTPAPIVTSTGGDMLVTFKSNGATTGNGFRANYQTQIIPFCAGQTTLTAANGVFDDGSGAGTFYVENSNCTWLIQPPGAVSIDLNFNYFDTQQNFDIVNVYNGPTTSDPLLGSFSGNSLPSTLTAGSSMLVEFTSNNFLERDGFEASYTSSNVVTLDITEDTVFVNSGIGNAASFMVNSNSNWNISKNANWLITNRVNGFQDQSVNAITTQPNIGPPRSTYVYATNQPSSIVDSVLVIQRGSGNYLTASPDTLFMPAMASQKKFGLVANVNWSANVVAGPGAATLSPNSGNADDSVAVSLPTNTLQSLALYVIELSSTAPNVDNDTVYVVQDTMPAPPASLSTNPDTITINQANGSMGNFMVNSTITWQTSSPATWLDVLNPQITQDTNMVQVMANSMNMSPNDRFTYVAVQNVAGSLFDTVVVRQLGGPVIFDANPANVSLAQAANSSASAGILANLDWTASSGDPSWLSISPASGSANASLTLTATTANNSTSARNSYIAFSSTNGSLVDTIFVDQIGTSPVLSAREDTVILPSSSGTTANVNLSTNLNWSSNSGASWFNVNPTNGSSSATLVLTAQTDNLSSNRRVSFLALEEVSGGLVDTVVVIQDTAQRLNTSPDTLRLSSASGSTASFTVNAPSSTFDWVSNPVDNWINLSQNNGTGTTQITVTANSANTASTERLTYVLTTPSSLPPFVDSLVVIQEGFVPQFSVNPSSLNLNFLSGSNDQFSITTNLNWTISNPVSWLSVSSTSGNSDATISVTASSDNLSGSNRTAMLTITADGGLTNSVMVTQIDGSTPSFNVSRDTVFVDPVQGSTADFSVLANATTWNIAENTPWMVVNPISGNSTETVTITAAGRNIFGNPRNATLTISADGFNDRVVTVIQRPSTPLFQVAPSLLILGSDAQDFVDFNVSSNLISWKVEESTSWMSVSPDSGAFTASVRVTATATNNTGNVRSDVISVTAPPLVPQNIVVTQDTVRAIGIEEKSLVNVISIFPNPTKGQLTLEVSQEFANSNLNYQLFNNLGAVVLKEASKISNEEYVFDLSGLPAGFYYLSITLDDKRITKKVSLINSY